MIQFFIGAGCVVAIPLVLLFIEMFRKADMRDLCECNEMHE